MNYSKAIRLARARTGVQQRDLANTAGLDPSYVSLLESGKRTPSEEVIQRIADALKIPQPLFRLLAAEPEDLAIWDSESVDELAKSLVDLIVNPEFSSQ